MSHISLARGTQEDTETGGGGFAVGEGASEQLHALRSFFGVKWLVGDARAAWQASPIRVATLPEHHLKHGPDVIVFGPAAPLGAGDTAWPSVIGAFYVGQRITPGTATGEGIAAAPVPIPVQKSVSRILSFRTLKKNWDSYGAEAFDPAVGISAAQFVRELWSALSDDVRPNYFPPFVAPTSSGKVHFEWEVGEKYVELEVDDREGILAAGAGDTVVLEDIRLPRHDLADKAAEALTWLLSATQ